MINWQKNNKTPFKRDTKIELGGLLFYCNNKILLMYINSVAFKMNENKVLAYW